MRRSAHRAIEALLCLAIVGLLVVEIVPWRRPSLPTRATRASPIASSPEDPPDHAASAAPVDTVLRLFTDRVTVPARAPSLPQAKAPVDAPWLKYMGFASTAEGALSWYVKDTKTGRMIRVSQGQTVGGWTVVESATDRLVLKNGEELYSVSKR